MQCIELKKIFRRGCKEEKTPLACREVTDNGAIPREPPKEAAEDNKMGPWRKVCLVLSIEIGILYVVGLAWILPCRDHPTSADWNTKFFNIVVTTDVERSDHPSLALFGFADEGGGHLQALTRSDGKAAWNNTLDFIPRKISCDPGGSSCLVSGQKLVGALNASDGGLLWQTVLPASEGDFITEARLSPDCETVLCAAGNTLFLLNAGDGSLRARFPAPCSSDMGVRWAVWRRGRNITLWHVVCEDVNLLELWTVDEENAVNSSGSFSGDGSFDAPAWQRTFRNPSGRPLDITDVVNGRFIDAGDQQVAVTVSDGARSAVYVLDMANGDARVSVSWKERRILNMKRWPSEGSIDGLLLESVASAPAWEEVVNFSDPRPTNTRKITISTVLFGKEREVFEREAFTSDAVVGWSAGPSDLLVVRELQDGSTEISARRLAGENPISSKADVGNR